MDSLYNEKGQWPVPIMVRRKNIHAVFYESNYFPKGKFKLSNSFFHSESVPCFFSIPLISIANLFAMRYLWDVCNEDKCLHQELGQKPGQPGKGWPGQAFRVFSCFWSGLPEKGGLVKPGKHGHSQDSLATLATKAWPTWPCYFHGRAFSATLVKKAQPNPGLKDSSHAWPGFFDFQAKNL